MNDDSTRTNLLRSQRYEIEHALGMYAYSYVNIPAAGLYDTNALQPYTPIIDTCHIYFIGYLPRINILNSDQYENTISIYLEYLGERKSVSWEFPEGFTLTKENGVWLVEGRDGQRYAPTSDQILTRIGQQHAPLEFKVKYVGQSYGKHGSRSALTRLQSHETLQKIALQQAPSGYQIVLPLVAIQPSNQLITVINPHAKERDEDGSRVNAGLDKLFGTSERERTAIYEAAMIRYFRPSFNIEFKDSFPSTRLKILQDCYKRDFSAVIAEFCFDDMPFFLSSEVIQASPYHIAHHNLHTDEERRMFFAL